jgi:hypothetical protein
LVRSRPAPAAAKSSCISPTSSTQLEGGHCADLYRYEIGNEPSAGRAAGHAVMDAAGRFHAVSRTDSIAPASAFRLGDMQDHQAAGRRELAPMTSHKVEC